MPAKKYFGLKIGQTIETCKDASMVMSPNMRGVVRGRVIDVAEYCYRGENVIRVLLTDVVIPRAKRVQSRWVAYIATKDEFEILKRVQ
jgi:hypothetical protein